MGIVQIAEEAAKIHTLRLLSDEQCKAFLAAAEATNGWAAALSHFENSDGGRVDKETWDGSVITEPKYPELFAPVRRSMERALARFLDPSQPNHFVLSILVVARYGPGGHLQTHSDSLPDHSRFRRYSIVR